MSVLNLMWVVQKVSGGNIAIWWSRPTLENWKHAMQLYSESVARVWCQLVTVVLSQNNKGLNKHLSGVVKEKTAWLSQIWGQKDRWLSRATPRLCALSNWMIWNVSMDTIRPWHGDAFLQQLSFAFRWWNIHVPSMMRCLLDKLNMRVCCTIAPAFTKQEFFLFFLKTVRLHIMVIFLQEYEWNKNVNNHKQNQ